MNVFLTGASSGIGAALAAEFARRGAVLGLVARRRAPLDEIVARVPGRHHVYAVDVTDKDALIGAKDSEELRKRLLHEAGVAVLADIHFGARTEGEGQHIRFSYAASEEQIERGVARIADFVRANTRPPRK